MTSDYMTDDQRSALNALRAADAIYRQADAHRTELIGLCQALGVPTPALRETLGLEG